MVFYAKIVFNIIVLPTAQALPKFLPIFFMEGFHLNAFGIEVVVLGHIITLHHAVDKLSQRKRTAEEGDADDELHAQHRVAQRVLAVFV